MKYSEFKREVEKLGFTYSKRCPEVVVKVNGKTLVGVSTNREYIVDNEWDAYQNLHKSTQGQLFDLAYQLAKTPLAEREEEKRYYLRYDVPPLLRAVHAKPRYLYRRIYDGYIDTSFSQTNDSTFQTIFTESEIAEMDITGFQKVEVEE